MSDKSEVLRLIKKLDEDKEKKFISQILIMIKLLHLSFGWEMIAICMLF